MRLNDVDMVTREAIEAAPLDTLADTIGDRRTADAVQRELRAAPRDELVPRLTLPSPSE